MMYDYALEREQILAVLDGGMRWQGVETRWVEMLSVTRSSQTMLPFERDDSLATWTWDETAPTPAHHPVDRGTQTDPERHETPMERLQRIVRKMPRSRYGPRSRRGPAATASVRPGEDLSALVIAWVEKHRPAGVTSDFSRLQYRFTRDTGSYVPVCYFWYYDHEDTALTNEQEASPPMAVY